MTELYDPLTYENLMLGLTSRFQSLALTPLGAAPDIRRIEGPGIYALHYSGDFPAYESIADDPRRPIYVGKAVPPGSRKGRPPNPDAPQLRQRIKEHAKSIVQAENLRVDDFSFRSLAVESVWITLAERFLIDHYKPLWNLCLDGFGNHDPGSGRSGTERSWWDTLHPGRPWSRKLQAANTIDDAIEMVRDFLRTETTDDTFP